MLYDTRGIMEEIDRCPKCKKYSLYVTDSQGFTYCDIITCLWKIETEIWMEVNQ